MERIEIPGRATYSPVALTDLLFGAPLASRVLLGAFAPGQLVAAGVLGYYTGSAARDWLARRGVRYIDFQREFGADVRTLTPMPSASRHDEVRQLAAAMNDGFTTEQRPRAALAKTVQRRLMAYQADITGQEVVISAEIRDFTLARLVFPFALGVCDPISGDVAIFQDAGLIEPHVVAHEFCHRMGYLKELHAQVLSYVALRTSGDPLLVQAARCERLHRQLAVLSGGNPEAFVRIVTGAGLRPELRDAFLALRPPTEAHAALSRAMRSAYDQRMRWMGQNGLSDYDEGFTNLLWTFARSRHARQPRDHAAV